MNITDKHIIAILEGLASEISECAREQRNPNTREALHELAHVIEHYEFPYYQLKEDQ